MSIYAQLVDLKHNRNLEIWISSYRGTLPYRALRQFSSALRVKAENPGGVACGPPSSSSRGKEGGS